MGSLGAVSINLDPKFQLSARVWRQKGIPRTIETNSKNCMLWWRWAQWVPYLDIWIPNLNFLRGHDMQLAPLKKITSTISCWNGYGFIVDNFYRFGSQALLLCVCVKTTWAPKFVETKSKGLSWDGDVPKGHRIYKLPLQALIFCVDLESKWPF